MYVGVLFNSIRQGSLAGAEPFADLHAVVLSASPRVEYSKDYYTNRILISSLI